MNVLHLSHNHAIRKDDILLIVRQSKNARQQHTSNSFMMYFLSSSGKCGSCIVSSLKTKYDSIWDFDMLLMMCPQNSQKCKKHVSDSQLVVLLQHRHYSVLEYPIIVVAWL
jgi:hypothetical protein